jgi:hypothetical protein
VRVPLHEERGHDVAVFELFALLLAAVRAVALEAPPNAAGG